MTNRTGLPVIALTACAVIVVAAFLPWATAAAPPTISVGGVPLSEAQQRQFGQALVEAFGGLKSRITVTGWQGQVGILGIQLPNWLAVVAALFVAGFILAERVPNTRVPRALPIAFCVYGLAHILFLIFLPLSGKGMLEIGFFLEVIAYGSLLVALLHAPNNRRVVPPEVELAADGARTAGTG